MKRSTFPARKKARPKKISSDPMAMVSMEVLDSDHNLPLMIQPAMPHVDIRTWVEGQRDYVEAQLMKYGAILFRGFSVDGITDFRGLAEAACPDLFGDYGDLPHAGDKVYGVTPYPPDRTILFHNESSHMHRWPMRQFFYCYQPAKSGGMTPIADCRTLLKELEPDFARKLEEKKLKYVRNFVEGVDVSWQDFFKTDKREEVEDYCNSHGINFRWKGENDLETHQIAPAVVHHPVTGEKILFNQIQLHHISFLDPELRQAMLKLYPEDDLPRNVYYGDGSIISDEEAKALEELHWKHSVGFYWQKGDMLMVDNMLITHARKPYEEPRKMFVCMGRIIHQSDLK